MPKYNKKEADLIAIAFVSLMLEYIKQGNKFTDSVLEFLQWVNKELFGDAKI